MCICVLLLLAGFVSPASAQVVAGPTGSAGGLFGGHRPVDPNRASQRLSLSIDLSAGYDSNAEGAAGTSPGELVPLFASTGEAMLRYWRGKPTRFFDVTARSFVNYESAAREQLLGGELMLTGATGVTRRLQLSGGALLTLDPTLLASQFGAGVGQQEPGLSPSRASPQGVVEQRWLAQSGYVSLNQSWSARHSTSFEGRAMHRRPIEGDGFTNESQEFSIRHGWNFHRSAAIRATYRMDHNLQTSAAPETPPLPALRTSTADVGLHLERRTSPVRILSVDFNGGAALATRARLDGSGTDEFVLPVASTTIRMALTRVWSWTIEGTREISVLGGLTPESFETTSATVRLDAAVTRRVILGVSGLYSAGSGMETSSGAFETSSIRAQIQYGFGQCCGMFTSYSFYNHHLRDISRLPPGFPEEYSGHTIRLGLTWWLPLYGTF